MPTRSPAADFPVRFTGKLRPTQRAAASVVKKQLAAGRRRIHIVAPPGSGKTVLGLYLWTEYIRRPAVVLSPNSAIQAQWISQTRLFRVASAAEPVRFSTDPTRPGLLTSLTYQSVTLPRRGGDDLDTAAIALWQERLVAENQAEDPQEAEVWIDDLRQRNRRYYEERLAAYRKQVRDQMALSGAALRTLHQSALDTLYRLRDCGVGLVILDECHHLMGHWGRVLADARELLQEPIVMGLTATPPDRSGRAPEDIERYDEFFGPVDFEVPIPAVVKDGYLAPYQDLAYFVRPTTEELSYLATTDREFHEVVEDLCRGGEEDQSGRGHRSLVDWASGVMAERQLPTGKMSSWTALERRDPELAKSLPLFAVARGIPIPDGVPKPDPEAVVGQIELSGLPRIEVLVPVLDRYIRWCLLRSENAADHELAQQAIARLRVLGMQITETGPRPCASPVGRVMAYSRAKTQALLQILKTEQAVLGERIRAVVIADYEKTSAVSAEVSHLLDEEAGGAVAAFRALLSDPETDRLDPVLVTGSTVLVDDDLAERFETAARRWLQNHQVDVAFDRIEDDGFHMLTGRGAAWCPRVYVRMITELFQQGVTKCLVGTRGLLGEGWDAHKVNVLVNLTAVTTSMSVNQLRGRSIRLDPDDPEKLADNWDVVCVAPEFTKGLDDYRRFIRQHETIYGLTDDGAIEKGVGHVHAAFTELEPEGIEGSLAMLNTEMLRRAARRKEFRALWRIGQPYCPEPMHALEIKPVGALASSGFPPFRRAGEPWSVSSLALAVGNAVLAALREAGLLSRSYRVRAGDRAGGYVRVFLQNAPQEDGQLFTRCLQEVLGPLERPRYVVPRYTDEVTDTWLSRILPEILARYVRKRRRRFAMLHAVPSPLAKKKALAMIFGRHWNEYVSPGTPLYAHGTEGRELLERARHQGLVPQSTIHRKEVFL